VADSILLQLLHRARLELNTDRPPDIPIATLRRYLPGDKLTGKRLSLFLGDERVEPAIQRPRRDPLRRAFAQIAVQCAAAADDLETIDAEPDAMIQYVTPKLGLSTLAGLVHYLRETGTARRVYEGDLNIIVCTILFEASFQTRRDDLTERI